MVAHSEGGSRFVCPRCGHEAADNPFCANCGVSLSDRRLPTRDEWEFAQQPPAVQSPKDAGRGLAARWRELPARTRLGIVGALAVVVVVVVIVVASSGGGATISPIRLQDAIDNTQPNTTDGRLQISWACDNASTCTATTDSTNYFTYNVSFDSGNCFTASLAYPSSSVPSGDTISADNTALPGAVQGCI